MVWNEIKISFLILEENVTEGSFLELRRSAVVNENISTKLFVHKRVLNAVKECLDEKWRDLQEGTKLHTYLSIQHNQITWKDLKKKLNSTSHKDVIHEICQQTLLTYGKYFN